MASLDVPASKTGTTKRWKWTEANTTTFINILYDSAEELFKHGKKVDVWARVASDLSCGVNTAREKYALLVQEFKKSEKGSVSTGEAASRSPQMEKLAYLVELEDSVKSLKEAKTKDGKKKDEAGNTARNLAGGFLQPTIEKAANEVINDLELNADSDSAHATPPDDGKRKARAVPTNADESPANDKKKKKRGGSIQNIITENSAQKLKLIEDKNKLASDQFELQKQVQLQQLEFQKDAAKKELDLKVKLVDLEETRLKRDEEREKREAEREKRDSEREKRSQDFMLALLARILPTNNAPPPAGH